MQGNSDVSLDVPVKLTNLVSFFHGMELRYNYGLGTHNIVTFLGADFVEDCALARCSLLLLSSDALTLLIIQQV